MTEQEIYKILDEECRENGAINPHKAAKVLSTYSLNGDVNQKLDAILDCLKPKLTKIPTPGYSICIDKTGKFSMPQKQIDNLPVKHGDTVSVMGLKMYVTNNSAPPINESFLIGGEAVSWIHNISAYQFQSNIVEVPGFKANYKIGDPVELLDGGSPSFDYNNCEIYFVLLCESTH